MQHEPAAAAASPGTVLANALSGAAAADMMYNGQQLDTYIPHTVFDVSSSTHMLHTTHAPGVSLDSTLISTASLLSGRSSSCEYAAAPGLPGATTSAVFGDPMLCATKVSIDKPLCAGCNRLIKDRFLLKVRKRSVCSPGEECGSELWHECCLCCSVCQCPLSATQSCYLHDGRVFCAQHYNTQVLQFALKCGRCGLSLETNDLVHRCLNQAFHVHCFACIYCGQQLRKGDQYLVVEGQIICRQDYELYLCNSMNAAKLGFYDPDTGESTRKAPKRPRTILTSSQRRAFKASFEQSSKPCRKVRESLAKETGLSVRVVQVWFQNQRAKMKKVQRKQELQRMHDARKMTAAEQHAAAHKLCSKETDSDDKLSSADEEDSDIENDGRSDSCSRASSVTQQHVQPPQQTPGSSLSLTGGTPIDKLYSMHNTYFY